MDGMHSIKHLNIAAGETDTLVQSDVIRETALAQVFPKQRLAKIPPYRTRAKNAFLHLTPFGLRHLFRFFKSESIFARSKSVFGCKMDDAMHVEAFSLSC
jgi:hypothetical protein